MIFKSFSHLSRHAGLAKTLWVTSGNTTSQPAFFAKTNQLARKQSQLAPRNNGAFGNSDQANGKSSSNSSSSLNPSIHSGLCNSSSFSTLSPLTTLDDDKRREAILAESTGSGGSRLSYNHQHSLPPNNNSSPLESLSSRGRRCSTSSIDIDSNRILDARVSKRRYTVSRTDIDSKLTSTDKRKPPQTPPSSPVLGPINASNQLVEAELDLLKLDSTLIDDQPYSIPPTEPEPATSSFSPKIQSDTFSNFTTRMHNASDLPLDNDTLSAYTEPSTSPTSSLQSASTQTSLFETELSNHSQTPQISHKSTLSTIKKQHNITQDLYSQLSLAIDSASIPSVIASYQLIQSYHVPLTSDHYEKILSFLSSNILYGNQSQNLSSVLSIYMDIVSSKIAPTTNIYSSVISSLLSLAGNTATHKENDLAYFRLNKRHRKSALASVLASSREGDSSSSLYKATLDIFEASNIIKVQKFSAALYNGVINACVALGNYHMLYSITKMLEVNNCTLTADIFVSLIKGYGKHGDISAAVECYKHYKSLCQSLVNNKEYSVYAALIGAYFDSSSPENGLIFFNKILDSNPDPTSIAPVISEIIQGYCRTGDYLSALSWIQQVKTTPGLPAVDGKSLVMLLSSSSDASDITTSQTLFDLITSRRDLSQSELNIARSDFLSLCVKSNHTQSLLDAIKETQQHGGVWDLSTVILVSKHLLQLGDLSLALRIFNLQGSRYLKHMQNADLPVDGQNVDAVNIIVKELAASNNLNVSSAVGLMESDFFDAQIFSDVNGGGIGCIKLVWNALNDGSLNKIITDAPYSIISIINTHLKWIQASGANNSLGGLAIPTPLLGSLCTNFSKLVYRLISLSLSLEASFKQEVSFALEVLNDSETADAWTNHCHQTQPSISFSANITPISWDLQTTNQITIAAKSPDTLSYALELLDASLSRDELVKYEAFVSLVEAAALAKDSLMIKDVYKKALSTLPRPSEHPDALDAWIHIHRAVVKTAHISYEISQAAYNHLVGLGAYPDATGYGQLISSAPASNSHDEASDAIWMFNEARENHVVLSTFLYNVVLSKLSRARRLKDAIFYFKDMDATNTKKSSVTYGTMISACCRCGDESSARELFDEMEAASDYTPKIAPFNIMLQFYVHSKRDRESALEVFNRLKAAGIKPSSHTYKLLIDAYCVIEPVDIEAADNVLLQMIADDSAVTTKHYASLLFARGVCLKNEIAAQEFYNSLTMSGQVRPDKHIFQALLESYVVNKNVRSAAGVLRDMVSYGVDLDAYMANILIRGWAPVNLDKARGLFDHVVQEGIAEPSSFESIIRAYLYYGDISEAYEVLNLMASQLYPEPVIAKVQALIEDHSTSATKLTEDMLLESIFGQTSNCPSGLTHSHTSNGQTRKPIPEAMLSARASPQHQSLEY